MDQVTSLLQTARYFFQPGHNYMLPVQFERFDVNEFILLTMGMIILAFTMMWLIKYRTKIPPIKFLLKNIFASLMLILVTINGLQILGQFQYWQNYTYHPRSLETIARDIKANFPGKHNAQFISDLDTKTDPDLYLRQVLKYHLYPIDISDMRPGEKDLLIIVMKNTDAERSLKNDFVIAKKYNQHVLVAIKKK